MQYGYCETKKLVNSEYKKKGENEINYKKTTRELSEWGRIYKAFIRMMNL